MVFLIEAGKVIAAIILIVVVEVLVVALFPGVRVAPQPLKGAKDPKAGSGISRISRRDVSFMINMTPVSAWLFLPEDTPNQVPCIVMAHGLGGTKDMGLAEYAARFQAAGMAVLAFDYRHTGASGGEPRQLIWIPSQLEDYSAAVEYARGLKEIDPSRVAVWGTSLSGGHAIVTAAEDGRIACVSVQCPFLDGMEMNEAAMKEYGIGHLFRMVGHAQRDMVRSWLGLSPHKIPIVGRPGSVALMADAGAWEAFNEMAPDDYVNEACARIAIRMDKYRPISKIEKVRCPVLIQAADYDTMLPASVIDKAAAGLVELAEIIHYPVGHFDIYAVENFQKAVSDQLAFFQKHLGAPGAIFDGDS